MEQYCSRVTDKGAHIGLGRDNGTAAFRSHCGAHGSSPLLTAPRRLPAVPTVPTTTGSFSRTTSLLSLSPSYLRDLTLQQTTPHCKRTSKFYFVTSSNSKS